MYPTDTEQILKAYEEAKRVYRGFGVDTDEVLRQFRELLMGMGLEEIEAENAPFNPEVHNAVMREDADGIEPETVTAVFQKGYKYGDRVLRPAMVKVAN